MYQVDDVVPVPQYNYNPANADWSREMRGQHLLSTVNMEDYMILFTGRDRPSAKVWTAGPSCPPFHNKMYRGLATAGEGVCTIPSFLFILQNCLE